MGLRHMQINITGDLYTGMAEGFGDCKKVHTRFQAPGRKGVTKCVEVDICYICSLLYFLIMTVKGFGTKSGVDFAWEYKIIL